MKTETRLNSLCLSFFQLEDCALQLYKYKDGQPDYGSYLELESSLKEQDDEMEGFQDQ